MSSQEKLTRAFFISLGLHIVLIGLFALSALFKPKAEIPPISPQDIIHAAIVEDSAITQKKSPEISKPVATEKPETLKKQLAVAAKKAQAEHADLVKEQEAAAKAKADAQRKATEQLEVKKQEALKIAEAKQKAAQAEAKKLAAEQAKAETKAKAAAEAKAKSAEEAAQAKAEAAAEAKAEAKKTAQAEAKKLAAEQAKAETKAKAAAEAKAKAAEEAAQAKAEAAAEAKAEAAAKAKADAAKAAAANDAAQIEKYTRLISEKVHRSWIAPPGSEGSRCTVRVKLTSDGTVMDSTASCNGNDLFARSVENAIDRASPLPVPSDKNLSKVFRSFTFIFNARN
jgi:colicin import membrane protein